jgi:hypothetical protein
MNWTDTMERQQFTERQGELAARAVSEASHCLVVPSVRDAVEAGLKTDSPIEAIFSVWFVAARDHLLSEGMSRFALDLQPQYWVESPGFWSYRLDFALLPADLDLARRLSEHRFSLRIGVELDGHQFHEASRDQVIARNRRDRDLTSVGWRVLHFSGSELHRNPMAVVVEVLVAGADSLDEATSLLLLQR